MNAYFAYPRTSGGGSSTAQSANTVYAGPVSGASALPTFRGLVGNDLPSNPNIGNGQQFIAANNFTVGTAPVVIQTLGGSQSLLFITGIGPSPGFVQFMDLIGVMYGHIVVISQNSVNGSPPARTYTGTTSGDPFVISMHLASTTCNVFVNTVGI